MSRHDPGAARGQIPWNPGRCRCGHLEPLHAITASGARPDETDEARRQLLAALLLERFGPPPPRPARPPYPYAARPAADDDSRETPRNDLVPR